MTHILESFPSWLICFGVCVGTVDVFGNLIEYPNVWFVYVCQFAVGSTVGVGFIIIGAVVTGSATGWEFFTPRKYAAALAPARRTKTSAKRNVFDGPAEGEDGTGETCCVGCGIGAGVAPCDIMGCCWAVFSIHSLFHTTKQLSNEARHNQRGTMSSFVFVVK